MDSAAVTCPVRFHPAMKGRCQDADDHGARGFGGVTARVQPWAGPACRSMPHDGHKEFEE